MSRELIDWCSCCGESVSHDTTPDELIAIFVPFTQIELKLWRWVRKAFCPHCEHLPHEKCNYYRADPERATGNEELPF